MKIPARLLWLVALLTAPSWASPLTSQAVSADATWTVYADLEQFHHTQFCPLLREELSSVGIEEKIRDFAKVFGFHPFDDVREVLLYGNGQDPEKGVVLIRGSFDPDKVLAPIRRNSHYQEISHGNTTLHRWLPEEPKAPGTECRMMYGGIHGDLIVMSAGLDTLRRAIDVLEGSSPRAGPGQFDPPASASSPIFFLVAANATDQVVMPHCESAIFRQTERLRLAVGEVDGQLRADLCLAAKTGETASAIAQMAQGMVAYLTLQGTDQPRLADLAKKMRVSCENSAVRVHLESSPKEVIQFLAEHRQRTEPSGHCP